MNEAGDNQAPVLVVGAGPVGLVLACGLARRGTRIRLIDRLPEPNRLSHARFSCTLAACACRSNATQIPDPAVRPATIAIAAL